MRGIESGLVSGIFQPGSAKIRCQVREPLRIVWRILAHAHQPRIERREFELEITVVLALLGGHHTLQLRPAALEDLHEHASLSPLRIAESFRSAPRSRQ